MEGGGGYDPADYSFERYVPGQESPWGIPEVEGGNKDFYRNQFVNLLEGEQGFRDQQRTAAAIREENAQAPPQKVDYGDMWQSMGITPAQSAPVQVDENGQYTWDLGGGLDSNSSNADFVNAFQSNDAFTPKQQEQLSDLVQSSPGWGETFNWAGAGNPTDAYATVGKTDLHPSHKSNLEQLLKLAYSRSDLTTPAGGGPTAVPGYAAPVGAVRSGGS